MTSALPVFPDQSCPTFCSGKKSYLRKGEGHKSPTDHNKIQDVPEVTEIGARVQDQSQVNHLHRNQKQSKRLQAYNNAYTHMHSYSQSALGERM